MTVTPFRVAAAGILALCAVPFIGHATGRGQPPAAAGDQAADYRPVFEDCYKCHNLGATPREVAAGVTKLLSLKESSVWEVHDLHAKAVESLKGKLGERMGDLLYRDKDVTKRPECLACHAVDLSPTPRPAGHAATVNDYYRASGVSCEACHGLAQVGEKKLDWFDQHRQPAWRKVAPAEKTAKGLIDLRDPEVRAERCASCHVGNAAEGKFVTHAMFAAGHPPLPPLEVMTYTRDQPLHAKPPNETEYIASLSDDDAWKLFHYRKDDSASARQVAVGAAVGFREAMRSLAHEAEKADKSGGAILDFALFDCAACHHDLVSPSWRQEGRGTPGRPLPRTGPTAVLRSLTDGAAGFDEKFAGLVKACDARPFGDPHRLGAAARDLAAWSDGLAKKLADARYDDAATTKLLRDLAETARRKDGRGLDYDDAQQLLWAFAALREDGPPPAAADAVAALAGPGKLLLGRLSGTGERKLIAGEVLEDRLRRVSQYRPDAFRAAFDRIAAALGPAGR